MLTLQDVEAALDEALARTKDSREVATLTIAGLGRRLVAEHEQIEARFAALEGRRALAWAGPHDISRRYAAGDLVQRGSGLWLALVAVPVGDVPGASTTWRRLADSK